jgi:hypothetical protein
MARGRGGGGTRPARGTQKRDVYDGLPSDADYKRTAHRRATQQARRKWLIRLLVLAVLAAGVYFFGDTIKGAISKQARQTGSELEKVGGNITEGRDRRSGANLDPSQ